MKKRKSWNWNLGMFNHIDKTSAACSCYCS